MTARLATGVLSAAVVVWGGRDIAKSGCQTKGKKNTTKVRVQTVRITSGSPLVAFSLAGNKNRLQICPVPGEIQAPFTRRRCENETESLRIVSDTIVFGQSDRRVFTRRRCRDVQRRLRLVRRRRSSFFFFFVARRRLQNVNMRGLGVWDTVRLKHIVIRQVFPNVSKNLHQPVINPLFFFF